MKIASWNVNSVRSRLDHVLNWLDIHQADILCLQETKVTNDLFPKEPFEDRNLHVYTHGQKAYNGVCFISKHELKNIETGFKGVDPHGHARVISGTLNDVRIVNVYMPQGESIDSPKFAIKRDYYQEIISSLEALKKQDKLLICGDFNIARDERDVDDLAKRQNKCMFTKEEHSWLKEIENAGLKDAFREINKEGGIFSWWDYRTYGRSQKSGLRIDMTYITHALANTLVDYEIHIKERTREKPSDHVPVVAIFK